MTKIIRFNNFDSSLNEDLISDITNQLTDPNKDIKTDIIEKIKKSVNTDDMNVFIEKIDTILENPKEMSIEGLIQDAELYDFYLKYRNEIDEILSKNEFFENLQKFQSDNNCISVYDFVVKSTRESLKYLVESIKEDLSKQVPSEEGE